MKVLHIVDGPPLYTNCFLMIGDGGKAAVVDPAADASLFIEELEKNKAQLTHIFLTHGHHDHIASVEPLRKKYGAKLVMNKADAEQFTINADEFYEDGTTIKVDNMEFDIIFTPGHTPGSTCIQCGDLLFTGDTLFAGDIGRTDLPGGNMSEMRRSLKKLVEKVKGNPQVLPGHEEFSTMDIEKKNNMYLRG